MRTPELDASDLFEGVREDTGSISHHLELSTYSKTIVSSAAYKWLVGSLFRESEFHWDHRLPRAMVTSVRQPILDYLPKRVLSRQEAPSQRANAKFYLPLSLSQILYKVNGVQRRTASPPRISDIVVFTSSSPDQVQATTIKQYFDQTWARGGSEILYAIERADDRLFSDARRGKLSRNAPSRRRHHTY